MLRLLALLLFFQTSLLTPVPCAAQTEHDESHPLRSFDRDQPDYGDRLDEYLWDFRAAFVEEDTEALGALVKENRDFVSAMVYTYIENHAHQCLEQKEALDRDESFDLDLALSLAGLHLEVNGRDGLDREARNVAAMDLEKIALLIRSQDLLKQAIGLFRSGHGLSAVTEILTESDRGFGAIDFVLGRSLALRFKGMVESRRGNLPEARLLTEQAMRMAAKQDQRFYHAQCLCQLGRYHFLDGNLTEALAVLDEAVGTLARISHWTEVGRARALRPQILDGLGRTDEALDGLRELIAFLKKTDSLREAAGCLCTLARMESDRGAPPEEVLPLVNEALLIGRTLNNPALRALALGGKGRILSDDNKLDEALKCYAESIDLYKSQGNYEVIGEVIAAATECLKKAGKYPAAIEMAEGGLRLIDGTSEIRDRIILRNRLANLFGLTGRPDEALRYTKEALGLLPEIRIEDSGLTSEVHINFSLLYLQQGRVGESLWHAEKALGLFDESDRSSHKARALHLLGCVYQAIDQNARARTCFEQCLEIMEDKNSINHALTTITLASVTSRSGERDEAERLFRSVLDGFNAGDSVELSAYAIKEFGYHFLRWGEQEKALETFNEALAAHEGLPDHIFICNLRLLIGKTLLRLNRFDEALEVIERVAEKNDLIESLPEQNSMALGMRGMILMEKGELDEALSCFRLCMDIHETIAREAGSLSGSERGTLSEQFDWNYINALTCLERLYAREGDIAYVKEAFRVDERRKARIFLDSVAESLKCAALSAPGSIMQELAACRKRINSLQTKIGRTYLSSGSERGKGLADAEKNLLDEQDRLEKTLRRLRQAEPAYACVHCPEPIDVDGLQSLLDDRTAFVSYVIGGGVILALGANSEEFVLRILPFDESLTRTAAALLEAIETPTSDARSLARDGYRIYEALLEPLEDILEGRSRLLVSPDGFLNFLPFEALVRADRSEVEAPAFASLHYMVNDFALVYVPSGTAFRSLKERSALKKSDRESEPESKSAFDKELLAFGHIPYGDLAPGVADSNGPLAADQDRGGLQPLVHSKEEVEQIARFFEKDDVTLFLGADADETAARGPELRRHRFIHFATHAHADQSLPFLSSIILFPSEGEDGYMRVFEIRDCTTRADLVVLSACSTNRGEALSGEGVFGLVRAFLLAGADAVVATNWKVRDRCAAGFMKEFYFNMIERGLPWPEALQEVKKAAISGRSRFSGAAGAERGVRVVKAAEGDDPAHPFYWAAFVFVGFSAE